jgi:hypothetical protein
LPLVLQEYVHAAAESLNVDVAFIFLPLLSALGTAIGNSRSIRLKPGFVQPPNIWTGIIGRSGARKSPALEAACHFIAEHEREFWRQNLTAKEIYAEELAHWGATKKTNREPRPEPPKTTTCMMDDLTLEVLAARLNDNPRGIAIQKDELSHFFESLDLYHGTKGSDLSRWCSLHTGVKFALDRITDNRHLRIWLPRTCITGGVQPDILRRLLSDEYFERGLAARFNFAYPPLRKDRWSEAIIPDDLIDETCKLFNSLWELNALKDDHGQPCPVMLTPSPGAKEIFIDFYNECGETAFESDDREAAVWNKLTGYAARFALAGQLCRDPQSVNWTPEIVFPACNLARWQGRETARIYSFLIETPEQCELRRVIEFLKSRVGTATVRETKRGFWLFRDKSSEEIERYYERMVKAKLGEWQPVSTTPKGGQPTRKFRLFQTSTQPNNLHVIFQTPYASTSTQPSGFTNENEVGSVDVDVTSTFENTRSGSVDADVGSSQKITSAGEAGEPKIEPVSVKEPAPEPADIAIGKDPEGETLI